MKILLAVLFLLAFGQTAFGADVVVNWVTQDKVVPNATTAANFTVGLGVTEVKAALSSRSHTFPGVAPGTYAVWVSTIDGSGKELAPPITASVVVPPDATAPIPVTVTATPK